MNGHLGKQHSSVTLERRCQLALRALTYDSVRSARKASWLRDPNGGSRFHFAPWARRGFRLASDPP
jgi:hypothetical protein